MPNWVDNQIKITGNKEDLQALVKFVASDTSAFDFENIFPCPYGADCRQAGMNETEFAKAREEWCTANWWSDQNGSNAAVYWRGDDKVIVNLLTSLSSIVPIVQKLAERYPALQFEYVYEDWELNVSGEVACENGVIIRNNGGFYGAYHIWPEVPFDED